MGISEKHKKDYEKYEYQCFDKIHIPGSTNIKGSNHIIVNGNEITLGDSPFKLLLRLVIELKRKSGGWVFSQDLVEEKLFSFDGQYQAYGNLREKLQRAFGKKDVKKFIQNSGVKSYRISTHPDFITYDKKELLDLTDHTIKKLVKKLP